MNDSLLKRSTWLEIDLDAITNNVQQLRNLVGKDIKIVPVLKANAYGHGLIGLANTLIEAGADILACGSLEDGIELRESGFNVPIFVFASNTILETAEIYVKYNLIPTVVEVNQARALSEVTSKPIDVFVKVDAGRGRLGILAEEALPFLKEIYNIPRINIMGTYSHLAEADWPERNPDFAEWQIKRFMRLQEQAVYNGIHIPIWEIASSAAAICMPHSRFTACFVGRAIYGYSTIEKRTGHPDLKQALKAWKSRIIQKKKVTAGKFGQNNKPIRLGSPSTIGVIATGLHDGLMLAHSNGGEVLVRGMRANIWSPVCLEHAVIDLSNCPEAQPGDEVVIIGKQGDQEISISELVKLWKVSLTSLLGHLNVDMTRIYFKKGKPVGISTKTGFKTISREE